MRRAAKIDANHNEIADALRKAGCAVQSLANIGKGCPDLLVGRHGVNYLIEIKDGGKRPSERRLTDDELMWHAHWLYHGQVGVAETVEQAFEIVGIGGK